MASGLRALKRARTRTAIADSALRLFIEHGFGAVTVADVAAAAGVSERTVFRYFADKEDLLFAEDDDFRELLARELAARDLKTAPIAALRGATVAVALTVEDRRAELVERWKLVESSSALQARERARHRRYEATIYSAGVTAGLAAQTARLTARFGMIGYAESLQRWLEGEPDVDFRTHVEATYAEMRELMA
ncbi:TetR/AcrR family transcriptional regulator [Microbacterium hydrocarbonoxydans]|uniref:TetR/AcrR family transcriptional regulator n=1 Tax=Microbacterium hydrocarbonoxydans TaxID=273678 RepID=UPI0007BB3ABB|nr:TetR family transcriptional regulator [Microbacterium hydrocarbonoxydans]GAT71756.1 putative tetR family transcriptional regulator [Microbacterium sp. HM58-2]